MRLERRSLRRPQIDMTPMIDCVFQLLIFFMLTSTMQQSVIPVMLPSAAAQGKDQQADLTISIDPQGRLHLNQQPVAIDDLANQLRPLLALEPQRVVTIRGDRHMPYEH